MAKKKLSVPEKHQLKIAKRTLQMTPAGANVMGGMNHEEAREFLKSVGYSDREIKKLEENTLNEAKLRQAIRQYIAEYLEEQEELDETSSVGGMGGAEGYQTPAAFVGKGGKQRKNRWHKGVTDRLGYETVWDEEDADELGPNAKKRSNYVGTDEQINEAGQKQAKELTSLLFDKGWKVKSKSPQGNIKPIINLEKDGKFVILYKDEGNIWASYGDKHSDVNNPLTMKVFNDIKKTLVNENINESFAWDYFYLKNGIIVDERGRKVFNNAPKFKSIEAAENWLEDNDERGTVKGDWKTRNENMNEAKIVVQKKDLQSFVNRKLKMRVPVSVIKKTIIPMFGLQSIEIVNGKVKSFVVETTQSADTDFADLSGKELFTGQNDISGKNAWVKLVAELTGFEVIGYGEAPDTFVVKGDPQTIKGKTVKLHEMVKEGRRGKYQIYRDDDSMTAHQKIGESIKRMRKSLKELNKEVDLNLRLKNESGIDSDSYWKRTKRDIYKISEHIHKLLEKIRRF